MGENRNAYILFGKPERKRPLERSRRRLEDNTKMNFKGDRIRQCELYLAEERANGSLF
jgi:hypothetical protein